jgi:toxin YoeB
METEWSKKALRDYRHWQKYSPKTVDAILELLEDIEKYKDEPLKGKGNPEYLKHGLAGYMSRRINLQHRLVYKVVGNVIFVNKCRDHYE